MTYALSRRNLLRGSLGVATTGLVGGLASAATAAPAAPGATTAPPAPTASAALRPVPVRPDAEVYGVTTVDPLIRQRADPFITLPVDGTYYFTGSVPEYDRIVVRGAPTIAGLATAAESVIWRRPASGKMGGHIWAPELHRIDGRWYIYFAAGDSDNVFRIRMYVLESALADPRDPAGWRLRGQIATEWEDFSLDATTFAHRGRRYLVWAQAEPELTGTNLYIAEMDTPWSIRTKPVRIATPTRGWEKQGFTVNEGPAVLVRNGRVFMTFSASATDSRYCMGLLTADAEADLLDNASWVKTPEPVFVTHERTRRYGPGHNSFTVAEDGVTDVLVYHARDYRDITGDPLYDPNRHARVQKLYWHSDGSPLFGVPVGEGGPIVRLSPADASRAFLRHYEYVLRVDTGVRELADSQFRFVPGLAGGDTESIQSVNFPDRYVRVVDGVVRIDPVTAGSAEAASASFRRVPQGRGGVAVQLATDAGAYLRHDRGRLTVGALAGRATIFLLS
ncbi:family 43 glycosylhydrolase [Micromonospora sp. KC723]|uniref:family 43 glycosylhydrolase n=1 Tax=Micromonospora sp. KC723 TaxID=2530381 RepID=UPI00104BA4D6|nr:family 43 glycosylhydrolase [Micromonospora sp. KC723]TDB74705.1 alpha-arabinofuranosidase [Micromonospora sp. KC723]